MPMKKTKPAASPDAYVAALTGWRRASVGTLRAAVLKGGKFEEVIKWGHLVYFSNGPCLLIRAEDERVLFGFWRGQRLREIEPRLKPGGKYEMATMTILKDTPLDAAVATTLAKKAVSLNKTLGNPCEAVGKGQ